MSYFYVMPKGDQISLAWGDETKDTVFGGIAWSGHNADLAACQEADARISELENRLDGERAIRDQLRNQLGERNRKVYYGVLAHPDYGDDCPLLARMGYTRRSDQDSGLDQTRADPASPHRQSKLKQGCAGQPVPETFF